MDARGLGEGARSEPVLTTGLRAPASTTLRSTSEQSRSDCVVSKYTLPDGAADFVEIPRRRC